MCRQFDSSQHHENPLRLSGFLFSVPLYSFALSVPSGTERFQGSPPKPGGLASGSDWCAAPLSRTKDHPRVPRHRQMCRFVRVAEGFLAENAVFVPRHRQDGQMARVVAGKLSSIAFRCDAFRQSVRAGPAIDSVGYAFAARPRL